MGLPALLASALCTFVLPLLLFLAAIKLWDLYCVSGRDRSCALPLPPGTMGFPFFGETLQMVLQRRKFLQMKRRKYGFIYKTHLFGRPTVRVMGADNVRRILLGEHRLVSVHWPASVRTILGSGCLSNLHDSSHKQRKKVGAGGDGWTGRGTPFMTGIPAGGCWARASSLMLAGTFCQLQVIMRAFSREALECYVPVITEEVGSSLEQWLSCGERGLLVYPEVKRLMFRIAMRILLGCEPQLAGDGDAEQQLVEAFEEMTRNLFSLPIDVPFSGLYRGMKARNLIHARIEQNIRAKICGLRASEAGRGCKDALQLLIEHSWERGERLDMQALKQSSTELLFGGHETTASAATSLITYLGLYPHVLQKVREELKSKGLLCKSNQDNKLDMEILEQLKYIGCVIKETLRLNPPVPGGFRVALKTFELNGYQIPKGWNVIYSICDTHDVAEIFTNKEEFNPDRFMLSHPEDASRFSFIPFGGGLRSCVGKEFAKILLKIFTVELARHCDWQLLNGPPTMKTSPTVYPVDNLPARFTHFHEEI
ncbi:cytochrome P450 26A1 isoform X1 [Rhinopithecus roxellana]|uniref:cytochrome P450 26A1 isoform X1 n=1 Tax=Rhinopithecus roxellana TaxID=61622 RepID=UPI001237837C|nr:cytochrome P450 26A1 isoform X1 [Rhinopithecus roxellana]